MMKVKVFIVDDHTIFRNGLKALLEEIPSVEVVGEASDGYEFLEKVGNDLPLIVLMDINMPRMNGIVATRKVMDIYPGLKVLALSMYDDSEYLDEMLEAGAAGYMLKNIGKEDLEKAIENIKNGKGYFCDDMVMVAAQKAVNYKEDKEIHRIIDSFTSREIEVLELICKGKSNIEISEELFISPRTAGGHRNNMLIKTGLKNTASLVGFAIKHKIVKV
ncbi:MAG: response regulator [Bacteroidota bacterium]